MMKTFNCYCVGYSENFVLKNLQDISEMANGKLYKIENEQRIDYVHVADEETIIKTIMEIGMNADLVEISLKKR